MKSNIDYNSLMYNQQIVGKSPVCFTLYSDSNVVKFLQKSQYSFIFILHGELNIAFTKFNNVKLKSTNMIVVDKKQIVEIECIQDTIVLEFEVLERMIPFMQNISQVFSLPCSEIIPLNKGLQIWCKQMLTDMIRQDKDINNEYFYQQCSMLTYLLLEYPRNILGTLYIPLYACMMQCDNCSKFFIKDV